MVNDRLICPLCNDKVDRLVYRYHFENEQEALHRIKLEHPDWTENDGLCGRCADYYHTRIVMEQRLLPEVGPYFPVKSPDDFIILPSAVRLDADPRFTGRGVCIALIDSGFYPHEDLVKPKNRIRAAINICTGAELFTEGFAIQDINPVSMWHGTMTSVVCAGNGYRSGGLYKSLAPEAELVLLKVQDEAGRILPENLLKALLWIEAEHRKFGIRIVNISLGVEDDPGGEISACVARLTEMGLLVVAAAGNNPETPLQIPASCANVITTGGLDDHNRLNIEAPDLYHSSFGVPLPGIPKPELLAQSVWLAAPILPGTPEKELAEQLHRALSADGEDVQKNWTEIVQKCGLGIGTMEENGVTFLKQKLLDKVRETKFFSSDYMHVDGTSFAAPLVCACIAQLLQAEPELDPGQIRHVLFSTATRIPQLPVERQGFGYIRPRKAILKILKKGVIMRPHSSPFINRRKKTIEFYIQNDCAQQISLSGSFNNWAQDVLLMEPGRNGMWKISIPMLPEGTYRYKFFIDDRMWVEDVDNPYREPDGHVGWNSLLEVQR